jgi:hypothetical protein
MSGTMVRRACVGKSVWAILGLQGPVQRVPGLVAAGSCKEAKCGAGQHGLGGQGITLQHDPFIGDLYTESQ